MSRGAVDTALFAIALLSLAAAQQVVRTGDPAKRGLSEADFPRVKKLADGVYLLGQSSNMGQNVFQAPSVFNFYAPNFPAPGTTLAGPPFKLMLTGTILNRSNFVDRIVMGANIGADNTVTDSTGTRINLAPFQALAANPDAAGQLLDRFNLIFMHNTLSPQARQAILTAVNTYPANDTLGRVRQAAYLVATSAQYQVEQ